MSTWGRSSSLVLSYGAGGLSVHKYALIVKDQSMKENYFSFAGAVTGPGIIS